MTIDATIEKYKYLVWKAWNLKYASNPALRVNKQDFISDGMIGLWRAVQTGENMTNFEKYALRCIVHAMNQYSFKKYSAKKRAHMPFSIDKSPEPCYNDQTSLEVKDELKKYVPEHLYPILLDKFGYDLTWAEIASKYGWKRHWKSESKRINHELEKIKEMTLTKS